MHVSGHIRERGRNFGMNGVVQVEDKSPARIVIVGKKHPAGWHCVLCVMNSRSLLIGGNGG
jgi:hypothetical protein